MRILSLIIALAFAAPALAQYPVWDGLDEVNYVRAKAGLRPFIRDQNLTQGAANESRYRADNHIEGHIVVGRPPRQQVLDMNFLPTFVGNDGRTHRTWASRGGVGTASPGWMHLQPWKRWSTCCTFENWTYAGAAWTIGRDGVRYMTIFVR